MAHVLHRLVQGLGQLFGAGAVVLHQVKRHARGRLDAHAGQAPQRLDQRVKGMGLAHG